MKKNIHNILTVIFSLFLILSISSCGKKAPNPGSGGGSGDGGGGSGGSGSGNPGSNSSYVYFDSGLQMERNRFPLKFYVNATKYNRYQAAFTQAENDFTSNSGIQLISFVPSNQDPKFEDLNDTSSLWENNGEMWILFKDNENEYQYFNEGQPGDGAAAVAKTSYYPENGNIVYSMIIMDLTLPQWSQYNFRQVLFHELSHAIGFSHTDSGDYSIMNYEYSYNTDGLTYLDVNRMHDKYPFSLLAISFKDLEKIAHNKEKEEKELIAADLQQKYGLSDSRSFEVANVLKYYYAKTKKRELTESEMNYFANKVLGFNYTSAKSALEKHIQGDSESFDQLVEQAAATNSISPEHVTDLIQEYLL